MGHEVQYGCPQKGLSFLTCPALHAGGHVADEATTLPTDLPLRVLQNGPREPFSRVKRWPGALHLPEEWNPSCPPAGPGGGNQAPRLSPHLCRSQGPGSPGSSGRSPRCSHRCHSSCWGSYPPILEDKREAELKTQTSSPQQRAQEPSLRLTGTHTFEPFQPSHGKQPTELKITRPFALTEV